MTPMPQEIALIKRETLVKFWPIACLVLAVYIPVSFVYLEDYLTGYIHCANFVLLNTMMPYCLRYNKILLASNSLGAIGMLTILPWIFTGGPADTGYWLSITYVVGVFLVTTKRSAIFWLSFYLLASIAIAILAHLGFFKLAYSIDELINLWFIYVITFVFIYLFNQVREKYIRLSQIELIEKTKAEDKFKALLESTPDALVIVDNEGIIAIVNHQTEQIFGYQREEIIGQKVELLIPDRFKKNHPKNREGYSSNPHVRSMGSNLELYARRKDGTEFPVEISLSPLKSEGLVLSAIRDVTKNKEQEERILKYSILEAKSKEMEQFTYIASHDLRHPLLTIINFIKVFEEDFGEKMDETAKKYLTTISDSANRMDKLILGLLDYSRLSKMKQLEEVDCNDVMKTVLADLDATIKESNASIHFENLPKLIAYPLDLSQLFQNLITNAIKFKKKDRNPQISITVHREALGYRFEFQDNGIGIEKKDQTKIFQIFQRLHTLEEYDGVGLGLAYCKKIVELHNGNIWVESEFGLGSKFCFTINT